jgi:hypothetical protein
MKKTNNLNKMPVWQLIASILSAIVCTYIIYSFKDFEDATRLLLIFSLGGNFLLADSSRRMDKRLKQLEKEKEEKAKQKEIEEQQSE